MGSHLIDSGQIIIFGTHQNQLFKAHVEHGPGRGPDIFRIPRANQDNGYVLKIEFSGHHRIISKRLKK